MKDLAKIEEIYYQASQIPFEKRSEFLRESCGIDNELRSEVESLLSFDEQAKDFIETPPADIAAGFIKTNQNDGLKGKSFGHYRILSLLGAGGMGKVYLARDTKLDRQATIKILPSELAADSKRMIRFVREAKSASALNHPNIITIYEIGETDGVHFIAAEFIIGETIDKLFRKKPLEVQNTLDIAIQVASALDTAHQAGIIHRDIKPENIMIRPDGLVKVLDFGIAKLVWNSESRNLDSGSLNSESDTLIHESLISDSHPTETGMIIGTATYMSPEQAKGSKIDARSDIFSFGIVLYEMLTGKRPFSGDSPLEIISSILKDEPHPIEGMPPEVWRIVDKMLRKDCAKRYQTTHDLLTELKNVRRELDLLQSSELRTTIIQTTNKENQAQKLETQLITGEFGRRKFGLAAVSLILLILAGLGVWFFGFRTPPQSAKIDSIAVLPFQNAGGNANSDFLGDGLAEALINSLTKISELRVMARSTAFRFRGREGEPQFIGRELGVKTVLTGRITEQNNQISIQVDLINTADGTQIFGNRYDGNQTEILELQQKIVRDVSGRLQLSTDQQRQVIKKDTEISEAYKVYLRGRFYWNKRSADDLRKAIQEFKQAADLDPNYALAFVGLADSYLLLEEYTGASAKETLPQAEAFAKRALEIDDTLGEAHVSLAVINSQMWRYTEAEREFKRAIELNPKYSTTYLWYCTLLRDTGRFDEALAAIKQAQNLDPLSSIIGVNIGIMHFVKDENDAAVKEFEKLIGLDPNYWNAYSWLGLVYLKQGRNGEAFAALEKGVELSRRSNRALSFLGYAKAVTGNRAEAESIVKELEEKYAKREATILNVAMVYAGLGDKNQSLAWLEKGLESQSGESARIRWYPPFAPFRNDSRYQSLILRMGQKP